MLKDRIKRYALPGKVKNTLQRKKCLYRSLKNHLLSLFSFTPKKERWKRKVLSDRESPSSYSMFYIVASLFSLLFFLFSLSPCYGEDRDRDTRLSELVRSQIHLSLAYETFQIRNEELKARNQVIAFYEERGFQPAWLDKGVLSPTGETLLTLLKEAHLEGLYPEDYHTPLLERLWREINKEGESVASDLYTEMELLLTNAFFLYASDLTSGRIHPHHMDRVWVRETHVDLVHYLEETLALEEPRQAFTDLSPLHQNYQDLLTALHLYMRVEEQGGWIPLPSGEDIREGDENLQVALLRARLKEEPFLRVDLESDREEYFDEHLKDAVALFQRQRGLEITGTLNSQTRTSLNIPASTIIQRILINLERWRWLPPTLGERYILVNIPDFHLYLVEDEEMIMEMRVIVGHNQQKTPLLKSHINHLVFSPRWYIPTSITLRKYLDMVRDEPEELERLRIRVYERTDEGFIEVDHRSIDWESVDTHDFPYYFWQDAGPWNSLGSVIFMFPNPYYVYLHDTPDKSLFQRSVRNFSEGCIRIERPRELALYLLPDEEWDEERIQRIIDRRVEVTVFLEESIPVYLQYFTAWTDERGVLRLIDDVYHHDGTLKRFFSPFN